MSASSFAAPGLSGAGSVIPSLRSSSLRRASAGTSTSSKSVACFAYFTASSVMRAPMLDVSQSVSQLIYVSLTQPMRAASSPSVVNYRSASSMYASASAAVGPGVDGAEGEDGGVQAASAASSDTAAMM